MRETCPEDRSDGVSIIPKETTHKGLENFALPSRFQGVDGAEEKNRDDYAEVAVGEAIGEDSNELLHALDCVFS